MTIDSRPASKLEIQPVDRIRQLPRVELAVEKSHIELKLDANEGPLMSTLDEVLAMPDEIRQYPSRESVGQLIAERYGVHPSQVLITCGADDAIDRVCRAFLQHDRNIVVTDPTFPMIPHFAMVAGGQVRRVPWMRDRFPVDQLIGTVDERTSVIALVSPNNPTGGTISAEELLAIGKAVPQAVLLVDQAYAEFEEEELKLTAGDLTTVSLAELPNALVVRTFSKAWGMAGLRVGYALGHEEIISLLNRAGGPYPVSVPALKFAAKMMQTRPDGNIDYLRQVRSERTQLAELLNAGGGEALPSQANFVYARFGTASPSAEFICRALDSLGIAVRSFLDEPDFLRITCPGNQSSFDRLTTALQAILKPEAMLFDMDGVLVDESTSFREAIRLTCEEYGVPVSMDEIAEKKLCGDANNDWKFTYRLLCENGVDCSYEEVKQRYERHYQGDESREGLWQTETQLVDRQWLQNLSQRIKLGIVTGRPRRDAIRFLESGRLSEFFSAIVCLEDGPTKPDPANVNTALKQLGVRSAWMVGDTPDDVMAARRAGVVPLGILAPEDEPTFALEKLNKARATLILEDLKALDRYLP